MNKHTPGDWFVTLDGATVSMRAIIGGPLIRIASIDRRRKAYDANARLIAAAPDMLAALETLTASLDWEEKRSGTTYHGIDSARAAIARARGEA